MASKSQLQQLLLEDQEPFHLHDYIEERRTKLRTTSSSKNQFQVTHFRKPLSDAPTGSSSSSTLYFPVTFCKNACFNVKNGSPDLNRASPVFHIPKSPVKLLQIPSKTAALLLEAALRIHKASSSKKHTRGFGTDFSFFGSVLKKLSAKRSSTKCQTTSFRKPTEVLTLSGSDMDFCFNKRRREAVWSEDKSLDTETSCSSSNSDLTRIGGEQTRSPSSCPSPDFSSRPPSPCQRTVKNGDEEEKEQCSPVCVLDPPFEEDDQDDHDGYGPECSYAAVQRKKRQILHKLSRFEALADLDPKDLKKLIIGDELCDETDLEMLEENCDGIASDISLLPADEFLQQVLEKCGFHDHCKIPTDMKRLVSDLIAEEEANHESLNHMNDVVNTVCTRFSSWNEVERNTIDMMVDEDFRQESCKWKTYQEELRLVAMHIELDIYASLVREVFM